MPSKFAAKLKAAGHSLKETKPSHEHDDTGTTPMSDVGLLATPNQERMSKLRSPSRLSDWLQSVEDGYFSQRHKIRRRVHPYYLEKPMEVSPRKTLRGVKNPEGPMQENIAYIWPKRAVLYCDSQPSLPPLDDDNLKLPHRDIVSLSNAGFEIKEIAATVTNAPKARALRRAEISDAEETDRKPEASLCGRFSQRDQDYRQKLGTFSTSIRKEGSKKAVKIYNVLKDKSVAQLFHGVIGCINHSTFTWTPPQDPTHTNEESNVAAQYDLPPPHDFPEYDRKRLDELLNTPLPSFARFLRHCPSTFQHYFPKTFDKDREKMYHRDDQMVKAAEEERMERWEELKALKQLQNKKTTTTTSSSQDNQAQASKGRKRTSQDSTSLVEDNMVRNNKRARTEQGSNTGSVVASSILDVAPTAPYHRHRHQFGLNSSHERSTSRSAYPSLEGESASIIQTRRSVEVDAIDQLVHEELSPVNQNWKMFASRTTLTYSSYPFKTPNSSLSIATMPDVFDHDGTAGL